MIDRFAKTSWKMLASLMAIVVAQAVYIKTLHKDTDYSILIASEARALGFSTQERQAKVEVDVIKAVGDFTTTLEGVKTELRLLRQDVQELKHGGK